MLKPISNSQVLVRTNQGNEIGWIMATTETSPKKCRIMFQDGTNSWWSESAIISNTQGDTQ